MEPDPLTAPVHDGDIDEPARLKEKDPALCVDLDGTLLSTDVLWESILILLKSRPWQLFLLPFWLVRGKAHLKRRVVDRVDLTKRQLPCREEVLEYLRAERSRGREVILATATERRAATQVVARLEVFTEIIATEARRNLRGAAKSKALVQRFGQGGFDYVGNGTVDMPVWRAARQALLVNPSATLLKKAKRTSSVGRVFEGQRVSLSGLLKAIRMHQWFKNVLVFVPLIMAHRALETDPAFRSLVAFLVFGLIASSIYLLNDLFDLEADRNHPTKKQRPLAAGSLPIPAGIALMLAFGAGGALMTLALLPLPFLGVIGLYVAVCVLYTLRLRTLPVVDTILLGCLYTLRIVAGGVATGIVVSNWLMAFSTFFFLSLAFMKRFSELSRSARGHEATNGRGYVVSDAPLLQNMGVVSGYVSVLVLALYINSDQINSLYARPGLLWLICPILVYGVSRMWLLAYRGEVGDDPLMASLKDPLSYALGASVGLILLWAA